MNDGGRLGTLAFLGAGVGILLGRGLELCFGTGQYLQIILFGVLAGVGVALVVVMTRGATRASRVKGGLAGAVVGVLSLAAWFLVRILPLVREEMTFNP